MRRFAIMLITILFVNICFPTTVYLRKGGTIKGEVISKDDEKFVIKTADGEKTIKWRSVKNQSIKEIYPELYDALKAKALEKKKKKSDENAKKVKNAEKTDWSRVYIHVETNEKSGKYEKIDLNFDYDKMPSWKRRLYKKITLYRKEDHGKINIKINRLDPKKKYELKIVYSHYLDFDGDVSSGIKPTLNEKNIVRKERLSGKSNYEIEVVSSPYFGYKEKLKGGMRFNETGKKTMEYGDEAKGWDVSIWLNDELIYEHKKGKNEIFYNNISH